MKTIVPDYYTLFSCKAGACKNTCCAGWEIDIDEDTLAGYKTVGGDLGSRMKDHISDGHFVLTEDERCPFLNSLGLCDIITELGEDALCQVCADHPRFRNFISGRTETGLGLTCEAAAELILSRRDKVRFVTLSDDGEDTEPTEEEAEVLSLRDEMLKIAQDRSKTIDERMALIADASGIFLPQAPSADVYMGLERLDEKWTERLKQVNPPCNDEITLEQLLVYLIYRHILPACEDGDIEGRTVFVLSSVQFIRKLGGDITDTARMWSSEIEYSDENIGILTEASFA